MSIIRDLGLTVQSLEEKSAIFGGSTGNQVFASTADATSGSAGGSNGRVIDRMSDLFTKDNPLVAVPFTLLYAFRGSTAADRKLTLGVELQHGDSSGGGDMADYSTQSQPDDHVFFTTARTTDMVNWTTAPARLSTNQAYYDLRAAKRFIRAVHYATKNSVTTESTGDEGARLSGGITFIGGATPKVDNEGFGSTSTST